MLFIGDKVVIFDEFGREVIGEIVGLDAYDVPGQYAIDTGGYGVYSRSEDEIRKEPTEEKGE